MIRARHTIMLPGRTVLPGETAEAAPAEEARLVSAGFAVAVRPPAAASGSPAQESPAVVAAEAPGKGRRHR